MSQLATVERRLVSAFKWLNEHWGPRRAVGSIIGGFVLTWVLSSFVIGAIEAYAVTAPENIVTEQQWLEVLSFADELESELWSAITIGVLLPTGALIDVGGRITFAYLHWVPEGVWVALRHVATAIPSATLLLNLCWATTVVATSERYQAFVGEIHG